MFLHALQYYVKRVKRQKDKEKIICAKTNYTELFVQILFLHYGKTRHTCDMSFDLSADLEFVLVVKKLLQVELHLRQSQVELAVRERIVTALYSWSGCDGTVHRHGEGAHPSLQAGDISLDLAEKLCERVL